MSRLQMDVQTARLQLKQPFRISGYLFECFEAVRVTLRDGEYVGRGEASGVYYLGDDTKHMLAVLESARPVIESGLSRNELRFAMPAGGARNAVDCAMWDLESDRSGQPAWKLAGKSAPRPLRTTFTLGADDPYKMAAGARAYAQALAIKVKLTGDLDLDLARVHAIRTARPDVWLGVDGNQGFEYDQLGHLIEGLMSARVELLEQPLKRGREADLRGLNAPIRIAGDESLLVLDDIEAAVGCFDVVNIKLDKCGGLTEGLMIATAARRAGLDVMVGNMGGSSLAMAPSFVLGQECDIVDLDGPVFLAEDYQPSVIYAEGKVWATPQLWGGGAERRT